MEVSEARALVEKHVHWLVDFMGVSHWSIQVSYPYQPDEERGVAARVHMHPDYDLAEVYLHPNMQEDEIAVVRNLRHELLHLNLSPIELFWQVIRERVPEEEHGAMQRLFTHAVESSVRNLERMLNAQGAIPAELIERRKQ